MNQQQHDGALATLVKSDSLATPPPAHTTAATATTAAKGLKFYLLVGLGVAAVAGAAAGVAYALTRPPAASPPPLPPDGNGTTAEFQGQEHFVQLLDFDFIDPCAVNYGGLQSCLVLPVNATTAPLEAAPYRGVEFWSGGGDASQRMWVFADHVTAAMYHNNRTMNSWAFLEVSYGHDESASRTFRYAVQLELNPATLDFIATVPNTWHKWEVVEGVRTRCWPDAQAPGGGQPFLAKIEELLASNPTFLFSPDNNIPAASATGNITSQASVAEVESALAEDGGELFQLGDGESRENFTNFLSEDTVLVTSEGSMGAYFFRGYSDNTQVPALQNMTEEEELGWALEFLDSLYELPTAGEPVDDLNSYVAANASKSLPGCELAVDLNTTTRILRPRAQLDDILDPNSDAGIPSLNDTLPFGEDEIMDRLRRFLETALDDVPPRPTSENPMGPLAARRELTEPASLCPNPFSKDGFSQLKTSSFTWEKMCTDPKPVNIKYIKTPAKWATKVLNVMTAGPELATSGKFLGALSLGVGVAKLAGGLGGTECLDPNATALQNEESEFRNAVFARTVDEDDSEFALLQGCENNLLASAARNNVAAGYRALEKISAAGSAVGMTSLKLKLIVELLGCKGGVVATVFKAVAKGLLLPFRIFLSAITKFVSAVASAFGIAPLSTFATLLNTIIGNGAKTTEKVFDEVVDFLWQDRGPLTLDTLDAMIGKVGFSGSARNALRSSALFETARAAMPKGNVPLKNILNIAHAVNLVLGCVGAVLNIGTLLVFVGMSMLNSRIPLTCAQDTSSRRDLNELLDLPSSGLRGQSGASARDLQALGGECALNEFMGDLGDKDPAECLESTVADAFSSLVSSNFLVKMDAFFETLRDRLVSLENAVTAVADALVNFSGNVLDTLKSIANAWTAFLSPLRVLLDPLNALFNIEISIKIPAICDYNEKTICVPVPNGIKMCERPIGRRGRTIRFPCGILWRQACKTVRLPVFCLKPLTFTVGRVIELLMEGLSAVMKPFELLLSGIFAKLDIPPLPGIPALPTFDLPDFDFPELFDMPDLLLDLPSLPDLDLGIDFDIEAINLNIDLPEINLPEVDFPELELPFDPEMPDFENAARFVSELLPDSPFDRLCGGVADASLKLCGVSGETLEYCATRSCERWCRDHYNGASVVAACTLGCQEAGDRFNYQFSAVTPSTFSGSDRQGLVEACTAAFSSEAPDEGLASCSSSPNECDASARASGSCTLGSGSRPCCFEQQHAVGKHFQACVDAGVFFHGGYPEVRGGATRDCAAGSVATSSPSASPTLSPSQAPTMLPTFGV